MKPGVFSKPILVEDPEGLQGPAVYLNFPLEKVVPQIEFKHPDTDRLTTEFWYREDGEISYNERTAGQVPSAYAKGPSPEDTASSQLLPLARRQPWKYAQLVTLSSTHEEVGLTLILTFFSISTVMAQMSLAHRCVGQTLQHRAVDDRARAPTIYALLVVLKVIMWASISFLDATNRMNTKTTVVGDLVKDMHVIDQIKTTVYTTFFHLFSVPTSVTDTSVSLHVRKPVQPYVAFKNQGHRAWILGWPSKEQFKVVTEDRGLPNLILGAAFDLPLIITQVYLKLESDGYDYELDMLLAFIFSTTCFIYRLSKLIVLVRYKIRLYHRLKLLTSKSVADAEREGEQSVKEYIVNHRLMQDHCYTKIPSDVYELAQKWGFGA